MKKALTFATLAMLGAVFAAGTASACEWKKNQVTAAAEPAAEEAAAPATAVDPLLLARLDKTAILPSIPTEEAIEDVETE